MNETARRYRRFDFEVDWFRPHRGAFAARVTGEEY